VLEGSENIAVGESKRPNDARRLGKCRGWGIQAAEWCSKARKISRLGNPSGRMMLEGLENVVVGESKRPNSARRLGKYRGWGIKAAEWCSKARKISRLGNPSGRMMLEGSENVTVGESKRPNGARRLGKCRG
jgi:phage tail tape-measure protein